MKTALAGIMSARTLVQVMLGKGKPSTLHTGKVILFTLSMLCWPNYREIVGRLGAFKKTENILSGLYIFNALS